MRRSRKMIGRALALAALVGSAGIDVVPLTHAKPIAVSHELLQQASIITPEGVTVDPNNKEELKKYDNRHDLSELADTLRKEFGVTASHLTQLIACTGTVVCRVPSSDGKRIDTYRASGNVALQPNILVTLELVGGFLILIGLSRDRSHLDLYSAAIGRGLASVAPL